MYRSQQQDVRWRPVPSPSLNHPPMVLPDANMGSAAEYVPQQQEHNFQETSVPSHQQDYRYETTSPTRPAQPKSKLGLMSRKRALQRSQTAEKIGTSSDASTPPTLPQDDDGTTLASSPTVNDLDEYTDDIDAGAGADSDILTLDESYDDSPLRHRGARDNGDSDVDQSPAALSRRAELILAKAKERFLLMDENLRGARDLVSPLTAANLQRATSVDAATKSSPYYPRSRDPGYRSSLSSPRQQDARFPERGHFRFTSDGAALDALGRPRTAVPRTYTPPGMASRLGTWEESAQSTAEGLRGTRSQEFSPSARNTRPLHRASGDAHLEVLSEDNDSVAAVASDLERLRVSPATDDLRLQMDDLKGRISNLRDRARHDSFRRHSEQGSQQPSPFSDAGSWLGGFAQTASRPISFAGHPQNAHLAQRATDPGQVLLPDTEQQLTFDPESGFAGAADEQQEGDTNRTGASYFTHEGTGQHIETYDNGIDNRQSWHMEDSFAQYQALNDAFMHHPSNADLVKPDRFVAISNNPEQESGLDRDSVGDDTTPAVQAHEDREDAFDYQHFFLHSSMGRLTRTSSTSSGSSNDSAGTARGPAEDSLLPPQTPETPEHLQEIERRFRHHERSFSAGSVSTMASFATATEGYRSGRVSPVKQTNGSRSDSARSFGDRYAPPRAGQPPTESRRAAPPAAVAVAAMLNPAGRALGLKDKALVFMLVESLKSVCASIQAEDHKSPDSRMLRKRLEDARKILDGGTLNVPSS